MLLIGHTQLTHIFLQSSSQSILHSHQPCISGAKYVHEIVFLLVQWLNCGLKYSLLFAVCDYQIVVENVQMIMMLLTKSQIWLYTVQTYNLMQIWSQQKMKRGKNG